MGTRRRDRHKSSFGQLDSQFSRGFKRVVDGPFSQLGAGDPRLLKERLLVAVEGGTGSEQEVAGSVKETFSLC